MPTYEYKCPLPLCDGRVTSTRRENRLLEPCPRCGYMPMHRVFGFAYKPMLHEHWNNAVAAPISSNRQFDEELKRKSEAAFLNSGIEHKFVRVDPGDAAAVGATSEGVHESNVTRSRRGDPLLPEID